MEKKKGLTQSLEKRIFYFILLLHLWWKGWEVFWRAQHRRRLRITSSSGWVVGGKKEEKGETTFTVRDEWSEMHLYWSIG
jgi:hypothetical protein